MIVQTKRANKKHRVRPFKLNSVLLKENIFMSILHFEIIINKLFLREM